MAQLPLPDEYRTAIQNPQQCFNDPELKGGKVECNKLGLPLVWTGQFASVFKIKTAVGYKAVRCFTSKTSDHQYRYQQLHQHVKNQSLSMLVDFEYQSKGIMIKGNWFPIVKMTWANGISLDQDVEDKVQKGDVQGLNKLAENWKQLVLRLRQTKLAHGDLQHENILIQNGTIRLVDYDGTFVPSLKGKPAIELGHPHYQHPKRSGNDFYIQLDNFSALVIYLSLKALATNPTYWYQFHQDKHLIFFRRDFESPSQSKLFQNLKNSSDKNIQHLTIQLERACQNPIQTVPSLDKIVGQILPPPPPKKFQWQSAVYQWATVTFLCGFIAFITAYLYDNSAQNRIATLTVEAKQTEIAVLSTLTAETEATKQAQIEATEHVQATITAQARATDMAWENIKPVEQNSNRRGFDYKNFFSSKKDYNSCQDACTNDSLCHAWTYIKSSGECWLKHAVSVPEHNNCCISGVKTDSIFELNTNRSGSDYKEIDTLKDDPKLCQAACNEDNTCKAWTYMNSINKCWLKHSVPLPEQNNCCVSGVK